MCPSFVSVHHVNFVIGRTDLIFMKSLVQDKDERGEGSRYRMYNTRNKDNYCDRDCLASSIKTRLQVIYIPAFSFLPRLREIVLPS